jgi:hypothetical protein
LVAGDKLAWHNDKNIVNRAIFFDAIKKILKLAEKEI